MDAARLLGGLVIAGTIMGSSLDSASHALAAGQSGWSGNTATQPATSYDRYGQPITNTAPSVSQRAQTAFNDSSTAIRDGVEAGIRSANDQITRTASGAGTQLNQQAQNWSNSAANGLRSSTEQAVNSFTNSTAGSTPSASSSRGGVSSPWTNNGSTATVASNPAAPRSSSGVMAANGGWTSIGTGIAAPPLLVPQSPMTNTVNTMTNFGNSGSSQTTRPTYPIATANDGQAMHSVLTDPARSDSSSNSGTYDWSNWNNQSNAPPSIGRTGNQMGSTVRDSNLVQLQGANGSSADPQSITTARPTENLSDNWGQSAGNSPPATINSASNRTGNSNVTSPFGSQPIGNQANGQYAGGSNMGSQAAGPAMSGFNTPMNSGLSQGPSGQMAGSPMPNPQMMNTQMAGGQLPSGQMSANPMPTNNLAGNTIGTSQMGSSGNLNGNGQMGNGPAAQPWVPLVAAVLVMAFSLAANLYLGVSYLDARQKYQSLVRKTAETFRRVKAAA